MAGKLFNILVEDLAMNESITITRNAHLTFSYETNLFIKLYLKDTVLKRNDNTLIHDVTYKNKTSYMVQVIKTNDGSRYNLNNALLTSKGIDEQKKDTEYLMNLLENVNVEKLDEEHKFKLFKTIWAVASVNSKEISHQIRSVI